MNSRNRFTIQQPDTAPNNKYDPATESKNQILKTNIEEAEMTKYLTIAETAKIIRKALKEAFPDVKFSVRCRSITVGITWTDGPNVEQVKSVVGHLKAAYFDSSIDYQGSIYHMHQGQQVHLGADYLNFTREYTDQAIQRGIDRVYREYAGNFKDADQEKATVAQFRAGQLCNVVIPGLFDSYGQCRVVQQLREVMAKNSDRLRVGKSPTAAAYFVTHDDNYSMTNGSGFSVIREAQ